MANKNLHEIDSFELELDESGIMEYWTESRKAEAIPIEILRPEGDRPNSESPPENIDVVIEHPRGGDDVEKEDDTAGFTTGKVSNMNAIPYAYSGKLFMTINGDDYVGSAWCIYESSIFTAGHCLNDGKGHWASSVLYEGRYSNGTKVGSWAITRFVSLKSWTNNRNFQYDLAAGIATSKIRPTTGKMGWLAGGVANHGPYDAIGYPAVPVTGYNFDGKYMWHSQGAYVSGTAIIKANNNMTGGCSGGPWAINHNGSPSYANGINSHHYTGETGFMYSPFFGSAFLTLTKWLKDNGGN